MGEAIEENDNRNIYLIKYDGMETGVIEDNIFQAVIRGMRLTEVENITSIRLVYTEKEAGSK